MSDDKKAIEDVKREVSSRFLGSGGLHGVGLRLSENRVRLYVSSSANSMGREAQADVLKEIRRHFPDTEFEVVFDDRSTIRLDKAGRLDCRGHLD